jgi:hypothetical protein
MGSTKKRRMIRMTRVLCMTHVPGEGSLIPVHRICRVDHLALERKPSQSATSSVEPCLIKQIVVFSTVAQGREIAVAVNLVAQVLS